MKEARTARRSVEIVREGGNRLSVYGSTCAEIGETAFRHGVLVHQLADEIGDTGPMPSPLPPSAAEGGLETAESARGSVQEAQGPAEGVRRPPKNLRRLPKSFRPPRPNQGQPATTHRRSIPRPRRPRPSCSFRAARRFRIP